MGDVIDFPTKEEEYVWECSCGCQTFELQPDYFVCTRCDKYNDYEVLRDGRPESTD